MIVGSYCGPYCDTPLFVHVLGATLLFGTVLTVATLAFAAVRVTAQAAMLRRLAFTITLVGVWPAFILMRVGAQWVLSHEGLDKNTPNWVNVGFVIADGGILILLALTLLGWLALRRSRLTPWVAWLAVVYLVALGVAWFAMSAKPG